MKPSIESVAALVYTYVIHTVHSQALPGINQTAFCGLVTLHILFFLLHVDLCISLSLSFSFIFDTVVCLLNYYPSHFFFFFCIFKCFNFLLKK